MLFSVVRSQDMSFKKETAKNKSEKRANKKTENLKMHSIKYLSEQLNFYFLAKCHKNKV
jgi:hypothetical protein